MMYDWEPEALIKILPKVRDLNAQRDKVFEIVGVAVANPDTGEACFWSVYPTDGTVYMADYLKDIKGDVGREYDMAVHAMTARKQ